jgi:hypothetical protein
MSDKDLYALLNEFMEVIADLAQEVERMKQRTVHLSGDAITRTMEQEARLNRIRAGVPHPPPPKTLAEKVASLDEKVKALPT